jgi:hypothetical protein
VTIQTTAASAVPPPPAPPADEQSAERETVEGQTKGGPFSP